MSKTEIIVSIFGIIWVFFKSAGFLEMSRLAKLERLFQALEVGVSEAWTKVVKPWLESHPNDGKLPPHIREHAERIALDTAESTDKIVQKFDPAVVIATLRAAVEEAKRRGGK